MRNVSSVIGFLGKDAEIHSTKDGQKQFLMFDFANTEKYGTKEITTWYRVFVQNHKIVESDLVKYLKKGTQVLVEGKLTANPFQNKDGVLSVSYSISSNSIELLGGKSSNGQLNEPPVPAGTTTATPAATDAAAADDDLPF
jgi:single-strand DNA-binding protein